MTSTPVNIIKCKCGKKLDKNNEEENLRYGDHKNCLQLTPNDTILPPLIIINNVTFNICEIC